MSKLLESSPLYRRMISGGRSTYDNRTKSLPGDDESERIDLMAEILAHWHERTGSASAVSQKSLAWLVVKASTRKDGETWQTSGRFYKREGGQTFRIANPNAGGKQPASKPTAPASPQARKPSAKREETVQNRQKAYDAAHAMLKSPKASGDPQKAAADLVSHLQTLTVPQLKQLKTSLGIKGGSAKLKAQIVEQLRQHGAGKREESKPAGERMGLPERLQFTRDQRMQAIRAAVARRQASKTPPRITTPFASRKPATPQPAPSPKVETPTVQPLSREERIRQMAERAAKNEPIFRKALSASPFHHSTPNDIGGTLAEFYAGHLNDLGDDIDLDTVHSFDEDLAAYGLRLIRDDSGKWSARPASQAKSLIGKAAKRAPKGGITMNGKDYRGGQFIPSGELEKAKQAAASGDKQAQEALSKIDASHAESETKQAAKRETRRSRGVSVAGMRAKVDPHKNVPLGVVDLTGAKDTVLNVEHARRSYNALHKHHGELLGHRISELIDQVHDRYTSYVADFGEDEYSKTLRRRLRLYGHMLNWGLKDGRIKDTGAADARGANVAGNLQSSQRIITARDGATRRGDEAIIPGDLQRHLNEHQRQGVSLAVPALLDRGGFLNADSTGVGKTRQNLAISKMLADQGKKVLYVTTAAILKPEWNKGTFAEGSSVNKDAQAMGVPLTLNRGDGDLAAGQTHLTTYENLARFADKIDKDTFLVFDEAHFIKEGTSQRGAAGRDLATKAGGVLYATATPGDQPEHLAYLFRAQAFDGKPWDEVRGQFNDDKLGAETVLRNIDGMFQRLTEQGLMVRRELALDNMDASVETVDLPEEAKAELESIAGGDSKNAAQAIMQARLRQERHKVPHAVAKAIEDIKAGHSVILFTSSVNPGGNDEAGVVDLLRQEFAKNGISNVVEYHSGSSAEKDAVQQFQSGKARVFITTIPSGSTGINLDDTVGDRPRSTIVMTPPWTALENLQIPGRTLRLTTKSRSKIRYLFANTKVDMHNYKLLSNKMKTMRSVVEGETHKLDLPTPKSLRRGLLASPIYARFVAKSLGDRGAQPDDGGEQERLDLIADILGHWYEEADPPMSRKSLAVCVVKATARKEGETWETSGRYYKRQGGRTFRIANPNAGAATTKPQSAPKQPAAGAKKPAATKRADSQQQARQAATAILKAPKADNPEQARTTAQELIGHLAKMTIPQLKELKTELGIKGANPKLKAQIIEQIRGHQELAATAEPAVAPAEKPAPSPSPAPPLSAEEFRGELARAMKRIESKAVHPNFVSLVDLRKELPHISREDFDRHLYQLRRSGLYTTTGAEGRDGLKPEERDAGIVEDGILQLFLSRRRDRDGGYPAEKDHLMPPPKPAPAKPTPKPKTPDSPAAKPSTATKKRASSTP